MPRISVIDKAVETLTTFVRNYVKTSGYEKLVIGLSGGVDSSLSAALGVRAIGANNLLGLILPYRSSSPESEKDAAAVAQMLDIKMEKIDISPMVDAYFDDDKVSTVRRGNKMARERMSIIFDIASRDNRLVLGTSNKTEICLGYATWYGDAACSLNPLGGLYKREVRQLAAKLEVPQNIIDKTPTADLWPGQTDEGELGISYEIADKVLFAIVEQGQRSLKDLLAIGVDEKTIKAIVDKISRYAFKRSLPATDLLGGNPVPKQVTLS